MVGLYWLASIGAHVGTNCTSSLLSCTLVINMVHDHDTNIKGMYLSSLTNMAKMPTQHT